MNAVILAAGIGSRLRPLTDTTPKCLVRVGDRPVLGRQIDALHRSGVSHVTVVAGYRAADVIDFCRQFGSAVSVVVNDHYDRTNNMVSLRLALSGRERLPWLICNGDVVFDAGIPKSMIDSGVENLIAVEPGRYLEESMKVSVDNAGRIISLSKAIEPKASYGVSIDLYRFSATATATLCKTADRFIDGEGRMNLWTEVAIDAILREVPVQPVDIQSRKWVEIDNFDDLSEAERLFSITTA